jgi:hypothetical protein
MMYDKYHEYMRMDYLHKHISYSTDEVQQFADNDPLCYTEKCLGDQNKSTTDFNIQEGILVYYNIWKL